MATTYLYVHLDSTSNIVITKGLSGEEFIQGLVRQPQNLLLLNPAVSTGEYEPHTGMKIIRGADDVSIFLNNALKLAQPMKWIDFADISMLKQLNGTEISELLYLGHAKTHLRSPFFYKLQNNFVYFDLNDDLIKIYYRHMEACYRSIGQKINKQVANKVNEKLSFFRKPVTIAQPSLSLLASLRPYLEEGLFFDFSFKNQKRQTYAINLYLFEDQPKNLKKMQKLSIENDEALVGTIYYHTDSQSWECTMNQDQLDLLHAGSRF